MRYCVAQITVLPVIKNPRIVIGATAFAAVAAFGGIGAATSAAQPNTGAAVSQLMSLLPKGFNSNNCTPADNPPRDSLATVDCSQNSMPNGPTGGRFSLYPDTATLDVHFGIGAGEDLVQPCPGGLDSPGNWHYNNTPDQVAGKLVCGTYKGSPDLMWSQYNQLVLGNLRGADLDSIYQFWAKNTA